MILGVARFSITLNSGDVFMNWLPNAITLSRIVLVLPMIEFLLTSSTSGNYQLVFGLFLLAALTDLLDGWLARRWRCTTAFGAFLDPLADKVIANVMLVFLACRHDDWLPLIPVLMILAREFAVQGFRSMALCVGVILRTDLLSKLKTFFQLVAIGSVLAGMGWPALTNFAHGVSSSFLMLALLASYISMILMFARNADLWRLPTVPLQRRD
jgi:CDP-diacylglycerol--glycerol-3-phosphate 3-phosphatidyltransferase